MAKRISSELWFFGRGEDLIDDRAREVARDHDLLEHAGDDEPERVAAVEVARVRALLQLGQELGRADDRAGDEMGEEREVCREVEERNWFDLAPIGVDDVRERLEREERDADRQDDLEQRRRHLDADVAQAVHDRGGEEAVVLEVRERAEVDGHCTDQEDTAHRLARGRDGASEELVRDRGPAEKEDVVPVPPAVEEVAGDHHQHLPPGRVRPQQPAEDEHDREEDRELDGGEEHRARA